jgi:hypothetical protein
MKERGIVGHRRESPMLVPDTPEMQTAQWQKIFDLISKRIGQNIVVPKCVYTEGQIKERIKAGRMLVFVPEVLSVATSYSLLCQGLPRVADALTESGQRVYYENVVDQSGWMDVEKGRETPNRDIGPIGLMDQFQSENREGMTANTYIIASLYNNILSGWFFDQDISEESYFSNEASMSALLGSRSGKHLTNNVYGYFAFPTSEVHITDQRAMWYGEDWTIYGNLGGRSVGRP